MKNIAIVTLNLFDKFINDEKLISSILNIIKNTKLPIITSHKDLDKILIKNNVNISSNFSHIYKSEYTFNDTKGIIFITKDNDILSKKEYKLAKKLNIPIRIIVV